MNLFISPHCDDECLFGSFTIQRERPLVVIVLDGIIQGLRGAQVTARQRRQETVAALAELGDPPLRFCGFSDARPDWKEVEAALRDMARFELDTVYAPALEEGGHEQHNRISEICSLVFPKVRHYMTYTSSGKSGGIRVPATTEMIQRKFRALACYQSQIEMQNCREHFMRGITEYYAA
jgi:LmbE family N-acetylglucosaminyl deacetylase